MLYSLCYTAERIGVIHTPLCFAFPPHSGHRAMSRVPCLYGRFSVVICSTHSINSIYMSIPIFQFIPVVSWAQFQFCKLKRALETLVMAARCLSVLKSLNRALNHGPLGKFYVMSILSQFLMLYFLKERRKEKKHRCKVWLLPPRCPGRNSPGQTFLPVQLKSGHCGKLPAFFCPILFQLLPVWVPAL